MKRKILVIGIGTGHPDQITIQAVKALNRADVLFIPDKGAEKTELAGVRREICARYIEGKAPREIGFAVPVRESGGDYEGGVRDWHAKIADIYERLLIEALGEDETGAFLILGDPGLYDSTLRILESIRGKGAISLDYEVIPGITAVQALTAAHKIPLNLIGEPITITTGRRLAEDFAAAAGSVVVMLDGQAAFEALSDDVDVYWGAYLGSADEILIAGRLGEVRGEIARVRAEARARKGWIMDIYLLRKPKQP